MRKDVVKLITLTPEQKKYFLKTSNFYDYEFFFPDIGERGFTITNETIHTESVSITEAVSESGELQLGGCVASVCEFEVSEIIDKNLTNLEFYAKLIVNEGEFSMPMGKYTVDTASMVDEQDYKKITAYDRLYLANTDVSEWFRSMFKAGNETYTIKNFRESLLRHLKIPYREKAYINDDIVLKQTLDPSSTLTGTYILQCICTLNCGFGRMDREGYFVISGINDTRSLFPEETLYPEEDLYPEDSGLSFGDLGTEDGGTADYISVHYEEYMSRPITCINVVTVSEEGSYTYGTDKTNPYLISDNFILFGKTNVELEKICRPIYEMLSSMVYRPCTLTTQGLPYVEPGDQFTLLKNRLIIESVVLSRTLSGVQGLRDTYTASGGEIRTNDTTVSSEIIRLNAENHKNSEDIGETKEDLDSTKEDLDITKEDLGTTKEDLEGTKEDVEILTNEYTSFKRDTIVRLETTENSIEAEVTRATGIEGILDSKITVNERLIDLKVSKGDVSSQLSLESGKVTLDSNRLIVNSNNFTLDGYGNATFSGTLNAAGGSFSGNLSSDLTFFNYLFSNSSKIQIDGGNGDITASTFNGKTIPYYTSDLKASLTSYGNIDFKDANGASVTWVQDNFQRKSSSDFRLKKDIANINQIDVDGIYDSFKAKSYRMKGDQSNEKIHFGLLAQELMSLLNKYGHDYRDFDLIEERENLPYYDDGMYASGGTHYAINYENLHALHIAKIQGISKRLDRIENALKKAGIMEDD